MSDIVESVTIKEGTGKNNKPYTLYQLVTKTGTKASSFDPIAVGDEVELTKNGAFWNAVAIKEQPAKEGYSNPARHGADPESTNQLDRIEKKIDKLIALQNAKSPIEKAILKKEKKDIDTSEFKPEDIPVDEPQDEEMVF